MASTSPPTDLSLPAAARERTLARLADHVRTLVPVGAVAFLTVDEEDGTVERAAAWFADDALRDLLDALAGHPFDGRRQGVVEAALHRERPLLLPRLDAWEAAPALLAGVVEALGPERARRAWRGGRSASVIACPLRTEVGRPLGVLVVVSLDPDRPLRPSDGRAVEVVADLAALALERAALVEDESRRARDELRLKRAAEAVSASLELEGVYEQVVEHAAAVTGASRALLTRLNARAGQLQAVAGGGGLTLDARAFGRLARTRQAVRHEGEASLMHAPIELGPRLYGVLSVAHDDPGRFGDADLALLSQLARSAAGAIANAIDFERERRIARSLTLGFVPESLPEVEGLETGLLYAPALGEPTGGDLYGLWTRPGGEVALLVGDVAGKGVENAALSAMVRFFVEARCWDAASPAAVLEQTNSMLLGRLPSDSFVTAFLGVLAPDGVTWASAGHLPPLHVTGDGLRPLRGGGLPLGVETEPGYRDERLDLAVGDLVFAYTDGLVEARRGAEIYGTERLGAVVEGLAGSHAPEALVSAVHDAVASWAGALDDDAVALALRRRA